MQTIQSDEAGLPPCIRPVRAPVDGPGGSEGVASLGSTQRSEEFLSMLIGFRPFGGLLPEPDLALRQPAMGIPRLARWIARQEVLSFAWRGNRWFPMFQFEHPGFALRWGARRVMREFPPTACHWDLALWWLAPNDLLSGSSPLAALALHEDDVAQAARGLRFAVTG